MADVETKKAIEYIGVNIQTYRAFDFYFIPTEGGRELQPPVSRERLLKLVYEYYNEQDRFTPSDLYDIKDAKECKRFLKSRVNNESYQVGLDWLERHNQDLID